MKVWSNSFLDNKNLVNIQFKYDEFDSDTLLQIVKIIKAYYKENARTIQLMGFTLNGYKTKNPLTVAKNILTPVYTVRYNLNIVKFYTTYSEIEQDKGFTEINVPIKGYGLTYIQLKDFLAGRGIQISYNGVNDSDYILKCASDVQLNEITLYLNLVNKDTTVDYLKYLMVDQDKNFIFMDMIKRVDFNVVYADDGLTLRFNLPIYKSDDFLHYLQLQIEEMIQYSQF